MPATRRSRFIDILAPLLAAALVAGLAIERFGRPSPRDVEPYHRKVKDAADRIPFHVGQWNGKDQEVAKSAVALLQPNAIVQRAYQNSSTGVTAGFLFVHCRDARDLLGHYPPICYPAHGHTQVGASQWDMDLGDVKITGTKYEFSRSAFPQTLNSVVYDFIVMPDGSIVRDMQAVRRAAGSYLRHFLGAAQVQVIFDANVKKEDREEALQALIGACREVIQAIRLGEKP